MSDKNNSGQPWTAQAKNRQFPGFDALAPSTEPPEEKNWRATAYKAFVAFIIERRGQTFLSEDFRSSLPASFPQPNDPRKWSVVIMDAARDGLIVKAGYRITKGLSSHPRAMTLWEVCAK